MFRKAIATAALLLALPVLGAQAQEKPDWLPANPKKPLEDVVIGLSSLGSNVNAYVSTYVQFFQDYAKQIGVKVVVSDAQADPAKQATDVRDLVSQGVDAIIVWPANPKAVVPAVKQAHDQNIPVLITNSAADPSADPYIIGFSGPNHYEEGKQAGELMVEGLGGKGNVVMIMGGAGYAGTVARDAGFRDAISKSPEIKVLDMQFANWSREQAQTIMESYIARFGAQIDGVYIMDAGMGAGAFDGYKQAVSNGTMPKDHKVIFTDATLFDAVYDAIKNGEYYGSVLQHSKPDAELALKTAVLAAMGVEVPRENFYETTKVTQKNIGEIERTPF